ncbi:MAG: nucleotidyltransferase family protein [Candidatus Ranarchaeia archaeon]
MLAGGIGSRLRPLTYYFQKTMIPIGKRQKPLLEYIVRLLGHHNVSNIIMLVNYKSEQIKNYFEDGGRFNVSIQYLNDDPSYAGSGAAILRAVSLIQPKSPILVYYGDILSNLNIVKMEKFHVANGADATVALASGFRVRVGVAEQDPDGRITKFVEKPVMEKPVNTGLTLINRSALDSVLHMLEGRTKIDFYSDVIPYLISHGKKVYGFIEPNLWWYDIGSIERYEKLDNSVIDDHLGFLFVKS